MPTALVTHEDYLLHDNGPFHPERPNRLRAVLQAILKQQLNQRLTTVDPRPATADDIAMVHDPHYIGEVRQMALDGGGAMDVDTPVCSRSYDVALLSAGGAMTGVDLVLENQFDNVFVAHRPPGHHACRDRGMGFCLFNNVAVAARYAVRQRGLERVFVLDWDVHHGNGTQEAFYSDGNVFFCSLHQSPWYPFTGEAGETGDGEGEGKTLNLPLRAGRRPPEYLDLVTETVGEAMRRFQPQLILLSAGQDAHERDPLGQMRLTSETYGQLTQRVIDLAQELCDGRLVVCLEGGYDLDALSEATCEIIKGLLGDYAVEGEKGA